jgi:thiamine-phosphate pyrophosphorylase
MSFKLPRVYPITDTSLSPLSHAEQVKLLIEGGAKFIQLREKKAPARAFYTAAREALAVAGEKNVRIVINDRADVAFALQAEGLHLGQDDLPPRAARKLLGRNVIIGFSTHNTEQAVAALKMPIDYIAIGPVFPTGTKENPDPVVGLEGVRRVREAIGDFPLVAIGGITLENAPEVFAAGADSIALIGALTAGISDAREITERMKRFAAL